MSRRCSSWIAVACLTLAAMSAACGRSDPTGPSDTPSATFSESQGSNNSESQGSNNLESQGSNN